MNIELNIPKYIKLETTSGLSDVVLDILDSNQVSIFSDNMTEIISGVYRSIFIPSSVGNYTGIIRSNTLNKQLFLDIQVVNTESNLHLWLNNYTNKDEFKADLSNITEIDANIIKVNGVDVDSIDYFKNLEAATKLDLNIVRDIILLEINKKV